VDTMSVATFQQLKDKLGEPVTAAKFATKFTAGYFAVAFGATPKSELDQLVFDALVEVGAIDPDGPVYTIARVLKVTPAKAKSLLFQHQLRNDDGDLDQRVLATLAQAKFSIDDKRLSFGVESPLVRSVIEARLKALGIFSDISLSGEILRVPINQLGVFVRAFLTGERAEALQRKLNGVTDDKGFVEAINKFGKDVAADLAKDATKDLAKNGLGQLFAWLAVNGAGEMADAVSHYFVQG
jgi:hypothetical protein